MLSSQLLISTSKHVRLICRRNIGISAPCLQKATDPIQALFLQKIQEYRQKSQGGKMVDASQEVQRELTNELDRVAKIFGGGEGVDMTQFPTFKFEEAKIDNIDQKQ